jgi:uncharacterized membrane protein YdbT with pleckstrin-like domain
MGFPKKLLGEGETLVLELRPHAKRVLGPAALLLVVAPVATFVVSIVPAGEMQVGVRWAIAVAALLVLLRWSVWPFLVWWNTVYVITDRRLIMRTGVIGRYGHDMPLTRLNDVTFSHGIVDRMLGCGDLVVESGGERGQVVLDDVPRVEEVQRALYRLSDIAREEHHPRAGSSDFSDDPRHGRSADFTGGEADGGGGRWGRSRWGRHR